MFAKPHKNIVIAHARIYIYLARIVVHNMYVKVGNLET
jgi:hypothetical protein